MGNGQAKAEARRLRREQDLAERAARQHREQQAYFAEQNRLRTAEIKQLMVQRAFVVQAACRGFLARKEHHELRKTIARRQKIAEEIAATEAAYVANLQLVIEHFYRPLMACAARNKAEAAAPPQRKSSPPPKTELTDGSPSIPDLDDVDVKTIFSQIETIFLTNQKLSAHLSEKLRLWSWHQTLGLLFLDMSDFFKSYIQYVNNFDQSTKLLDALCKRNHAFREWLTRAEKAPICKANPLSSFLIMPIQRIPRYVLLLQDLLKATPEGHNDHEDLKLALSRMREVAKAINDKKRDMDEFVDMLQIFNRFSPKVEELLAPHRRFVKEGLLKENGRSVVVFLFSDLLIIGDPKGDKVRNPRVFPLKRALVADPEDLDEDDDRDTSRIFQLYVRKNTEVTVELEAQSPEDKKRWCEAIQTSLWEQMQKSKSFSPSKTKQVDPSMTVMAKRKPPRSLSV